MRSKVRGLLIASGISLVFGQYSAAHAAEENDGLEEIIVTAEKRAKSANDVGLSITTVTSDEILRRGVTDLHDVAKLVPSLSVNDIGNSANTSYTLRGIGFNSASLGAAPTVSVYVDEIPLAYAAMANGAIIDLERLEVYKGPQGTLFGQNSTAGAINFIAAKPTNVLRADISAGYGRFDAWEVKGFISGPISDKVKVRLAASHEGGGAWQKSYTRNDSLGDRNRSSARLTVDMEASSALNLRFGVLAWRDKSDTQALQLVDVVPLVPASALPGLVNYPRAPQNARAADWEPTQDLKFNSKFIEPSLRVDWKMGDEVSLTTLTSYNYYKTNSLFDSDGTTFETGGGAFAGNIKSFFQEIRLSGDHDRFKWTVGVNYNNDKVFNYFGLATRGQSNTQNIAGFSVGLSPVRTNQRLESKAIFANAEFELTDKLSISGGARFTDPRLKFRGCNFDPGLPPLPNTPTPGVTQDLAGLFNFLYQAFTGNTDSPVQRGGCITLNGLDGTFLPTDSPQTLKENNVSWNVTMNYKPQDNILLYALASQGYKAGSFPLFGASNNVQYLPARQEGLRAYEAGYKLTLLDRHLQLNGAAFYYDYKNKQLSGYLLDAIFGPLQTLVNIPKSRVVGAEVSASWIPFDGLQINGGATKIKTKIQRYTGYDSTGTLRDFAGQQFNLSPKWFANADAVYSWRVGHGLEAEVATGLTYRSATSAVIGSTSTAFDIKSYVLVDASVGLRSAANGWRVKLWGKNIFNRYYWNNVSYGGGDTIARVAAMPATYGVTLGYGF